MNCIHSDSELVARLAIGDEDAFCILYARYWNRVKTFCQRFVRSEDLAENYAQDIFMKIWENRVMLDSSRSFSAYLYAIARNTTFNYLRHVSLSKNTYARFLRDYAYSHREVDDFLIDSDYVSLLISAINNLPARQQQIFRLSRNMQLTHKQIAEKLGISVNTVQEHVSNSLKHIKRYIGQYTDIVFLIALIVIDK